MEQTCLTSCWSFNRDDANYAGQDDLFNDLGKPLLDNAFKGITTASSPTARLALANRIR